jgi:hypothetical protein
LEILGQFPSPSSVVLVLITWTLASHFSFLSKHLGHYDAPTDFHFPIPPYAFTHG